MDKLYTRIIWKNEPSTDTPLNENNLNRMDAALDAIDDRVIAQNTQIVNLEGYETRVANLEAQAAQSATNAANSATAAASSETNAASSESAAATSARNAANSASAAATSESNAADSAQYAEQMKVRAVDAEEAAERSADAASQSAITAAISESNSETYSLMSASSADDSATSATASENSKIESNNFYLQSRSWAVGVGWPERVDQATDNSKYYSRQAKQYNDNCKNYYELVRTYSNIIVPDLLFDPATGTLYMSEDAQNIEFYYDDESGKLYYKFISG